MSNNMAKIADARKTVEQLKLEVNIERMMVSKAAADLMAFCEAHAKEDPLALRSSSDQIGECGSQIRSQLTSPDSSQLTEFTDFRGTRDSCGVTRNKA
ncbi:hypothetical protein DPEC_G00239660 [Dallia pectoralis]|uniref:Uncharacterized protein n=1 Tax=Dallia pectoralis TaxID=75939 RepID=A0ACC2FZI0_DALPE|nr:hypothetical protein DPEC_G00239660 [Dallia pectoralis]